MIPQIACPEVCKAYRDALRLLCDCVPVKEAKEGASGFCKLGFMVYRPRGFRILVTVNPHMSYFQNFDEEFITVSPKRQL